MLRIFERRVAKRNRQIYEALKLKGLDVAKVLDMSLSVNQLRELLNDIQPDGDPTITSREAKRFLRMIKLEIRQRSAAGKIPSRAEMRDAQGRERGHGESRRVHRSNATSPS